MIHLQAEDEQGKSKPLPIEANRESSLPTHAYRNRPLAPKSLPSMSPSLSPEVSLSFQPRSVCKHTVLSVRTTPQDVHQPLLMPWNQGDPISDSSLNKVSESLLRSVEKELCNTLRLSGV